MKKSLPEKSVEKFISVEDISKTQSISTLPRLVSQEEFDKHRKILDWTFGFIVAVLFICFTTFVLLIIDVWKLHSETVETNSKIIEDLRKENRDIRFDALNKRITELEKLLAKQEEAKIQNSRPSRNPQSSK